jgi:hypothetical protein
MLQRERRDRIRHGNMMNIEQLDAAGNKVCGWCFVPEGELAAAVARRVVLAVPPPDDPIAGRTTCPC